MFVFLSNPYRRSPTRSRRWRTRLFPTRSLRRSVSCSDRIRIVFRSDPYRVPIRSSSCFPHRVSLPKHDVLHIDAGTVGRHDVAPGRTSCRKSYRKSCRRRSLANVGSAHQTAVHVLSCDLGANVGLDSSKSGSRQLRRSSSALAHANQAKHCTLSTRTSGLPKCFPTTCPHHQHPLADPKSHSARRRLLVRHALHMLSVFSKKDRPHTDSLDQKRPVRPFSPPHMSIHQRVPQECLWPIHASFWQRVSQ